MNYENYCKVLRHIERHPREYNQNWYRDEVPCGTTHCFIGRAAVIGRGFYDYSEFKRDACQFLEIDRYSEQFDWISTTERNLDDFRRLRWMLARFRLEDAAGP